MKKIENFIQNITELFLIIFTEPYLMYAVLYTIILISITVLIFKQLLQ